jgi:hypothetical protein
MDWLHAVPPEILGLVLGSLRGFAPVIELVCCSWFLFVFGRWGPKPRAETLRLGDLALRGHLALLVWACASRGGHFTRTTRSRVAVAAAEGGHVAVLRAAREWRVVDYCGWDAAVDGRIVASAARRGHSAVVDLVEAWRAADSERADARAGSDADKSLVSAARAGSAERMRRAKALGATAFDRAMASAARGATKGSCASWVLP